MFIGEFSCLLRITCLSLTGCWYVHWGVFLSLKNNLFVHLLQAVGMFIGEFTCLVVFFLLPFLTGRRGRQIEDDGTPRPKYSPLIFLPAAMCDMCGTSIMYIGLNLTYASSFQMLRGTVDIHTVMFQT